MRTLQEIMARKAEIRELLKADDADLEKLSQELDELEAEERKLNEAAERRSALEQRVATEGRVVRTFDGSPFGGERRDQRTDEDLGVDSEEYRSAFMKHVVHATTGEWRLGEMSDVEQRAFSHTTSNTSEVVLPAGVQARIFDLVTERYSVLGDLSFTQIGGTFPFLQATSIEAGDPDVTAEGVADEEMETGWNKVEMTGVEIKPRVRLSRKMQIQSAAAFEDFLVKKLADRYGVRKNRMVIAKIKADILAGNKATPAALTDDELRAAFAKLKGAARVTVYANNATVWNVIAGIKDEEGHALFLQSEQTDDPTIQGRIYGKVVKVDDSLDDGEILYGDPDTVVANDFAPLALATAQDVLGGTFDIVHAGYSLSEARLGDTRAWGLITVDEPVVS